MAESPAGWTRSDGFLTAVGGEPRRLQESEGCPEGAICAGIPETPLSSRAAGPQEAEGRELGRFRRRAEELGRQGVPRPAGGG